MTDSPSEPRGLVDSARRLLSSVLHVVHTRFELAAVEIEEQLHRAAELLLWSLVGLVAAACGALMLGFLVVLAFWEHRVLAAGLVAAGYFLTAGAALLVLRVRARGRPRLFDASLSELVKDRDLLDRS